jgi:hypothetical protein
MSDYLKIIAVFFIAILIAFCIKRQRRYWREMHTGKPTGSLKAGYKLAIATVFIAFPLAAISNTTTGWELFISVLLMTVVFCVKITFSPAVIGLVLGICGFQLYFNDRFPFFEVWGSAASVIAWRLPEEFRVVYTALTFLWAMAILIGGGAASSSSSTSAAADISDATSLVS